MKIKKGEISRRGLLATVAASGAALAGSAAMMGQAPAVITARRFRGWVTRGGGTNRTTLQEMTLRPVTGRQIAVRTRRAAAHGTPGAPRARRFCCRGRARRRPNRRGKVPGDSRGNARLPGDPPAGRIRRRRVAGPCRDERSSRWLSSAVRSGRTAPRCLRSESRGRRAAQARSPRR